MGASEFLRRIKLQDALVEFTPHDQLRRRLNKNRNLTEEECIKALEAMEICLNIKAWISKYWPEDGGDVL